MNLPWHFHLSGLSALLPLIFGVIFYKNLSKVLKFFWVYIVVSFSIDLTSFLLNLNQYKTAPILNIFTIVEYFFLIYVLSFWNNNKIIIAVLKSSVAVFIIIFILLELFNLENFNEIKMISRTIGMVSLTAFSIITLFVISDNVKIPLYKDPRFWITSGILIYCAGNLLLFSIGTFIIDDIEIYFIHSILNTLANFCYAGGLFCRNNN